MFIKLTRVLSCDGSEVVYINTNHIIHFSSCEAGARVVLKLQFVKNKTGHNELSILVKESCEEILLDILSKAKQKGVQL